MKHATDRNAGNGLVSALAHERLATRLDPLTAAVAAALFALGGPGIGSALAGPAGEVLVGGNATVSRPNAQTTLVTQTTARAALDWTSFSIAASETVRFIQPSASAVALNRVVVPGNPSQIHGTLKADGHVFLVNPSGVLFGRGAVVDVAGLVGSTLNMAPADFMSGRYVFTGGRGAGRVDNHADIVVKQGNYIALLGNEVSNAGSLTAPKGSVALGAGDAMVLDFNGDGLLSLKVNAAAAGAKIEQTKTGIIVADGGRVIMSAQARNALLDTVLNVDGIVQARGAVERNGAIYLDGGESGITRVAGTLDVSSVAPRGRGGAVHVLGEYVGLFDRAKIDASGVAGGGTVLVGGDFQGANPAIANAWRTHVSPNAVIAADATGAGDGGRVIVWADDATTFSGTISARGGAEGGRGGFAEVSGKNRLHFRGNVDLGAAKGEGGTLLLDPGDITLTRVGAAGDDSMPAFTSPVYDPAAATATADIDAIESALNAGTSVDIRTTSGTGGSGDITIAADQTITKSGAGAATLRLNAENNIVVESGVTIQQSGGTAGTDKLNIVFNADSDANDAGRIELAGTTANPIAFTTRGGNITLGGRDNTLSGTVTGAATGGAAVPVGVRITAATLDAGAGAISVVGKGFSDIATGNHFGVQVNGGSELKTTTGTITLTGTGGAGTSANAGVFVADARVTSIDGDISINGTGGAGSGSVNIGVAIINGGRVSSTGTAKIVLTGTGGAGIFTNLGVYLFDADTEVTSAAGDIVITGVGAGSGTHNFGVFNGSAISTTGSANVDLTGTGAGGAAGISMPVGATIGGAGATGSITLTADTLDLSGANAISSTGALLLQPLTASRPMVIGASGAATDFALSTTALGTLKDGFSSITIGRADGTGAATVNAVTFTDPVTIRQPGSGGTIAVTGAINAADNATVTLIAGSDITVSSHIVKTGSADSALALQAGRHIVFDSGADVSVDVAGGASGKFDVVLNADRDASGGGAIALGAGTVIGSNGGAITLGGGADPLTTPAVGVAALVDGVSLVNASLQSGAGAISLRGTGIAGTSDAVGVRLRNGSEVVSTSGAIFLSGTGGAGTFGNRGTAIYETGTRIASVDGPIGITGTAGDGNSAEGVFIASGAVVSGSGAATITITGNGGTGAFAAGGVAISGSDTQIAAVDGDIAITGTGSSGLGAFGTVISAGASIGSTGAARIAIAGTGGAGDGSHGTTVDGAGTRITSAGGDISVTGTGGSGAGSHGTLVFQGASVSSTGAANIRVVGTGGGGGIGITTDGGGNTLGSANMTGDILLRSLAGTGLSSDATILNDGAAGRNVTLNAVGGGSVTQTGGSIAAGGLRLLSDASATFTLDRPGNAVATLAGDVMGNVSFTNGSALSVGTLTSIAEIGTPAGTSNGLATGGGSVTLNTAGAFSMLSIDAPIGTTPAIAGVAGGSVTLVSAAAITSGAGGTITTRGSDSGGGAAGSAGDVLVRSTGAGDISLAAITAKGGDALVAGTSGSGGVVTIINDSGALTVSSIDGSAGSGFGGGAPGAIQLQSSGGAIAQTASSVLAAGSLRVLSDSAVTLGESGNTVGTIAGNGSSFAFSNSDSGGLTVGNLGATTSLGVTTAAANGVATSAGDITLRQTAGTLTVGAGNIDAGSGSVALFADALSFAGTVTGNGGVTLAPATDGTPIVLGAAGAGKPAPLSVENALLDQVRTTGVLTIGSGTAGAITLGGSIAGTSSTWNTLSLVSGGTIADVNPDATTSTIRATSLAMRATGGIGANGAPIRSAVGNLAFLNTGAGGVWIDNRGALAINEVAGISASSAGDDGLTLGARSPLTISADVIQAGDITLTAGDSAGPGDDLTISPNVTVRSTAGNVTLTAGDHVTLGAGARVDARPDAFSAPTAGKAVTITAGTGSEQGTIAGTGVITAESVVLDALTGVGAAGAPVQAAASFLAARTRTSGDVHAHSPGVVTLSSLVSGTVVNGAGGAAAYVLTSDGQITVADPVNTSGAGATTLTTTNGDILVNAAVGNASAATTLVSAGTIEGAGTVTGVNVILDSESGVGTDAATRLNTVAANLAARSRSEIVERASVFVNEADAVTLASIGGVDNGTKRANAYDILAGGSIAIEGAVATRGGAVTLESGTGSITSTAAGTITTTNSAAGSVAGNVQLTAPDRIDLLGAVTTRAAHVFAAAVRGGDVTLSGPGGIAVSAIDTSGNGADSIPGGAAAGDIAFGSPATLTLRGNITARGGDAPAGSGTAGNGANLTFGAPVRVTGDVTVDTRAGTGGAAPGTDGNVTFADTVDSLTAGSERSLSVNTAAITRFDGAVGATTALASLATDAGGSTLLAGGGVTTTGAQTYNDALVLGADATLTSTASGNITFGSTIESTNAGPPQFGLTVNTSGITTFAGDVGPPGTLAPTFLITDAGGTTVFGGIGARTIITEGAQTYNDAVMLGADVTLVTCGCGPGDITFASTIDADLAANNRSLSATAAGSVIFSGDIGNTQPLAGLGINAAALPGAAIVFNAPAPQTVKVTAPGAAGVMTVGAVTLAQNLSIDAGAGVLDFFSSTIDGAFALSTSSSALTFFRSAIGATTPLASLTAGGGGAINLNAGAVTTTGAQSWNDPVVLSSPSVNATTLTSTGGANVAFGGTVDGDGVNAQALTIDTAGTTTFGDTVGAGNRLDSLTIIGGGPIAINDIASAGVSVGTVNAQSYGGPVMLSGNVFLVSDASGAITLSGTVDSTPAVPESPLTVTTGGQVTFGGAVGGTIALDALTTNGGGAVAVNVPTTGGTSIVTVNSQTFDQSVTVGGATGPVEFRGGSLAFDGAPALAVGNRPLTLTTDALTLAANVSGQSTLLVQPTAANVALGIAGGAGTLALPTGTLDRLQNGFSAITLGRADATAATTIDTVTFQDPVTVRGRSVFVSGPITGIDDASVTLDVTPGLGGGIDLGADLRTTGQPIAINGPVTLTTNPFAGAVAVDTTCASGSACKTAVPAGADVTFASTIDSDNGSNDRALTVTAGSGTAAFNGSIGSAVNRALSDFDVAAGAIALNASALNVNGGSVGGNIATLSGPVTLGTDLSITTDRASGTDNSLAFVSTLAGATRSLTVAAGDGAFTVGGASALAALEATARAAINLGAVTVTGPVTLTSDNMALNGIGAGGQTVTLRNASAGRPILLGGDSAASISLDAAEMNGIIADRLVIGRSDGGLGSGAITIGSDVVPQVATLRLNSGAGIDGTAGGIVIPAGGLAISATGNVTLTDPQNDVGTVAAITAGGFTFSDANALAVGVVDGVTGIKTGNAATAITAAGNLTLDAAIDADNAGTTLVSTTGAITGNARVSGSSVVLDSATGVGTGTGGRVNTAATSLAARSRVSGGVFAEALGSVVLATIGGVSNSAAGPQGFDLAAGGGVNVGGPVSTASVNTSGVPGTDATSGGIALSAGGGAITGNGSLTTGAATASGGTATSGSVALNGGRIGESAAARLDVNTGAATGGGTNVQGRLTATPTGGTAADGLFLSTSGGVTLGALDLTTSGAPVDVATTNAGTVTLAGNVTTNNGAVAIGAPVDLGGDVVVSVTGATVTFTGTVRSPLVPRSLTVTSVGLTTFGGAVGGNGNPLASVAVNGEGTTTLNGGAVTTTGAQTYTGNVVLGSNTILTGTTPTFGGTVAGGGNDLTLNFSGATSIDGAAFTGIRDLASGSGGTTSLTGALSTSGTQTYSDNVTLGGATVLDSGAGSVSFAGTLESPATPRALAITSGNVLRFLGAVGRNGNPLSSLTTTASSTVINGGAVTTTGTQTYSNPVVIGANTTMTSSAGSITFGGALDADSFAGARTLLVDAPAGTVTFSGSIGANAAFADLDVISGPNTIVFNGSAPQTVNVKAGSGGNTATFAGNVRLDQNVQIDTGGNANNNVTFADGIETGGATNRAFAINSGSGNIDLEAVGNATPLAMLTANGGVVSFNRNAIAQQIFIGANQALTNGTATLISPLAFAGFDGPAALTLSGPASGGTYGGEANMLRVDVPGLLVVSPNGSRAFSTVWLQGDASKKPFYQWYDDTSRREVVYNGRQIATSNSNNGIVDPQQTREILRQVSEQETTDAARLATAEASGAARAPELCTAADAKGDAVLSCAGEERR